MTNFKNKGFTLIELLVVIAVIGLLSSIVLVSMKGVREKARIAKTQETLRQVYLAIELARDKEDKATGYITGSLCCECPCRNAGELSTLPDSHSCIVNLTNCFNRLGLASLPRDAWGSPILLDENEYEWDTNPCRRDTLNSAGPDKNYGPAGHDGNVEAYDNDGPRLLVPIYSCTQ